jgi:hypothetical protein
VDSWITQRTNDVVFDLVESVVGAADLPGWLGPDSANETPAGVADTFEWVVVDHHGDGQNVVGVEPGSLGLDGRQLLGVQSGQELAGLAKVAVAASQGRVVDEGQGDPVLLTRLAMVIEDSLPSRLERLEGRRRR